jgi:hypothetical protein
MSAGRSGCSGPRQLAEFIMRTFSVMIIIVVFGAIARSQQPAPEAAVFTFGSTRDETRKVVGDPRKWYVPQSGRFLDSPDEYQAALKVYRAIEDVYIRETPTNTYLIKVAWRFDTTTSRLRPTERVSRLGVEIDKPAAAATILKDFREAAEICKAGCDLYGLKDITGGYVLAFPSKPNRAQFEMGKLLATDFKPEEATEEWCVAIKLKLDRVNISERKPPDWNGKITSLDIGADSLRYELVIAETEMGTKAAKIGTWAP